MSVVLFCQYSVMHHKEMFCADVRGVSEARIGKDFITLISSQLTLFLHDEVNKKSPSHCFM